ncbi:MAG: hypothetical protein ISS82_03990 [Nanoarchaeota archaeon]|nr:hypothetical protein [Nanoarchaeota archaeon]
MPEFDLFIKRLIKGAQNVFFRDVIKSSSGFNIYKVDGVYLDAILKIKESLKKDLGSISKSVERNYQGRANELSNYLEGVVKTNINNNLKGFVASIPKAGKNKQSAGYPDLIVEFERGKYIYIEIKTYQKKTINSGLRTFYFKPSEQDKVMESCPHVLMGFEVESLGRNNNSPFKINNFKIMDLYDLKVNLKPEFNASNPMIYKSCKEI